MPYTLLDELRLIEAKIKNFLNEGVLSKGDYNRRNENAGRRMKDNAKIETLSDEQHDALANLCSIRHVIHTNKPIIADNSRLKNKLILVNGDLKAAGLPSIKNIPTSTEDYIDIDTIDELMEYNDAPECGTQEYNDWYAEEYERISDDLELLNTDIEKYLSWIDSEYGTNYCPTGMQRVY